MMRKIMPVISQPSVHKENAFRVSGEIALFGHWARVEDTAATPAP